MVGALGMTGNPQSSEPVFYYRSQYREDRDTMVKLCGDQGRRIYTVNLPPRESLRGNLLERKDRELEGVSNAVLFLLCYFFEVLLDQAVHSTHRHLHATFDDQFNCPKLSGVLGVLGQNCNPMNLLVAADLYYVEDQVNEVVLPFTTLSQFFLADEYHSIVNRTFVDASGKPRPNSFDFNALFDAMDTGLWEVNVAALGRLGGTTVGGHGAIDFDINFVEKLRDIFLAVGTESSRVR
jgi:hypothetical protein